MRNTRQRRQQILQTLVEHGNVQVSELVARFAVSAVTIRADLTHIESQGLATRTHGGATLVRTPPQEQDIHEKDALNLPMKDRIGIEAAKLVKAGDNIIIDSGSTTMTLARHLRGHRDVTVMTNGLNIAWELANAPGVELLLTGGLLRKQSLSLHGSQAEASLNTYSFDTLFLGVDGLDLQFGLTTHHEAEASLNHRMVERARRIVVLTDASKFGRVSLHRIARLDQVHTIITDGSIEPEYLEGLQRLGVEVIIAESPP
ncbi:DeoR family transcriptional regulator [Stenotrophomonas sp. TWI273]|jgi:DeoR family transcriptional regulator of aga operon|uniref:DeoR family transcriptional regulator of aga operon n=1 Tax=Stenotrophomonas rhizophila TaxID=216778 RepID=A0AAW5PNV1_9GAMM|nr:MULTISPECIES: DeoR family transcriptional regulator [Stenotrophomonas]MCS4281560.1 DeoR family transcriptional regulator of aga operon [Stenotrophomonas rhizophila]ROP76241.1 DeoR family transcriptional regulator [Stenotrophomonas rhizophila]HAU82054.1 DeoR family transcriptional regulator [Stenotrophomonas sp.]